MANPQWWPLDSVVVTGAWANSPAYYAQFGQLGHNGIDLQAAIGTPVYATDDGVIHMEGWNISWSGTAGGIAAIIRHAWGYSGYAHLSSTIINAGQWVNRGQLIGYSGNTGVGTGPHLHFETFPPNVNFANGFSGRVNPASIINLQARGTTSGGGGGGSSSTPRKDDDMGVLHRDQDGSIYQADEFGFVSILELGGGMAISELIYAAETINGPTIQVNNRQRDLINSYARNRWNQVRAQIVAEVAAKTGTVKVDAAAITKAVTDAIKSQGVTVDTAAIAKAVEATLQDEFAAVSKKTVDELKNRL